MNRRIVATGVLLILALLVAGFGMVMAETACDPNPELIYGNDQNLFPEMFKYKFDDSEEDFGETIKQTFDNGDWIEVTYSADGYIVDWESNFPIMYVLVKGGPNGYLYCYGEAGAQLGEGLIAPDNRGGNQSQISHVTFYWGERITGYGTLTVNKFYDANADGIYDADNEEFLEGWMVHISGIGYVPTTFSANVVPGTYTITECQSSIGNWMNTTPTEVTVTVNEGQIVTVNFGNVCLGYGGGNTIGFWTNRNGQRTFANWTNPLAVLSGLNLKNANGSDFNPTTYTQLRNWLRAADAVNMQYMLSAQLAAMKLNVLSGSVVDSAVVYAPGVCEDADYIAISDLMDKANMALGDEASSREYLEALKDALDAANNNENFVQADPCDFDFDCTVEDDM